MKFDRDPSRASLLRDLLMNYRAEMRPAENAPPAPSGYYDDEELLNQFYEQWDMNPRAHEFLPEGNYPGAESGRPDADMALDAGYDAEMGQYLRQQMPQPDDHVEEVPMGPGGGRQHMLAQRLMRRG